MGASIMEAQTLPAEEQDQETGAEDGKPVEEQAEATRSAAHLFQFSMYVHAGVGAEECEHSQDGKCSNAEHFHAWVCMPNSIQHRDITEKSRAAKARRKRALRDAGGEGRQPSDAYVMLESDLDDIMLGDHGPVIKEIAERSVRKTMGDRIVEVRENDERFETYFQDAEEWRRLNALPEDERPEDEYKVLTETMDDFEEAVKARTRGDVEREEAALRALSDEQLRAVVRDARIDGECADASMTAYYLWLGFIGTRVPRLKPNVGSSRRLYGSLEDFRNASPEAVEAVDNAMRELENRMTRGDASGN